MNQDKHFLTAFIVRSQYQISSQSVGQKDRRCDSSNCMTYFKITKEDSSTRKLSMSHNLFCHTYIHTYITHTDSMSSSWQAFCLSPSQEISRILWNPRVYCRVHRSTLPIPILSQINSVNTPPYYSPKINFNIIRQSTLRSSEFLSFTLCNQELVRISHLPQCPSTCPAHLIILHLIILVISGEQ
jgi:hypothetical protein